MYVWYNQAMLFGIRLTLLSSPLVSFSCFLIYLTLSSSPLVSSFRWKDLILGHTKNITREVQILLKVNVFKM